MAGVCPSPSRQSRPLEARVREEEDHGEMVCWEGHQAFQWVVYQGVLASRDEARGCDRWSVIAIDD